MLILDDLSKVLTADTESAETTLKFLDHVINTASKKRCKVRKSYRKDKSPIWQNIFDEMDIDMK